MESNWTNSIRKIFVFIFLISVFCILFSPTQNIANETLDPSWQSSYNYFFKHSFQYGDEVVFTYGPLAFLYVKTFEPDLFWLKTIFRAVLGLITCLALFKVYRKFGILSFILLSIGIMICSGHDSYIFAVQVLLFFVLIFRLPTSRVNDIIIISVVFAIVSFLGYIKFTFWLSGLCLVMVFTLQSIIKKEWIKGLVSILAFIVSSVLIWLGLGQDLLNIVSYITKSLEVTSGYNEAMGISGPISAVILAIFLIAMYLVVIPLQFTKNYLKHIEYLMTIIVIIGFTFISWKHGFVREDLHITEFYSLSSFMFALFFTINNNQNLCQFRNWLESKRIHLQNNDWPILLTSNILKRILAIFMMVISISAFSYAYYQDRFAQELVKSRVDTLKSSLSMMIRPASLQAYKEQLEERYFQVGESLKLPKLNSIIKQETVDIYSYNQNYIIYNNMNWLPRPVFQSYSAYTTNLLKLNEHSLINGPEYVLFKNQTIDNRFPLLDDSLWLRQLMHRYKPVEQEAGIVAFKKDNKAGEVPQLTKEQSYNVKFNQSLEFPFSHSVTYASIDIDYSILGKLRSMFYRAPEVLVSVKLQNDQEKSFRIIPKMAKDPFLLSPLNETNDDFLQTLTGMNSKEIKSFKVYTNNKEKYFKEDITVTLYKDSFNTKENFHSYQKIMWPDIIKRPAVNITSDYPLERVVAYNTTNMLFHPRAEMVFELNSDDKILIADVGIRPEAKVSGNSDGVNFYWEGFTNSQNWESMGHLALNSSNFDENYIRFSVPIHKKYSMVRLRVDSGDANNNAWDWAIIKQVDIE